MRRRPRTLVVVLCLGLGPLVACSDDDKDPPVQDSGPGDARAEGTQQPDVAVDVGADLAADLVQWDLGQTDAEVEPDIGVTTPGEICQNPIVLTWTGDTIVRKDDTREYRDDYLFGECAGATLSWEYPNEDLVYRLDFPPGGYHARLVPDMGYAYLSIIDVRTSSCSSFESSCTMLADSDYLRTTVDYVFTIEQGETVYFVVDSFGQTGCGVEADCNGPFTLTLEQFTPHVLGQECTSSWQCISGMACAKDDVSPGFCTDYCETVDCASGAVPMTCADVGPVYYGYGSLACVPDDRIGGSAEFAECEWSYECAGGICSFPVTGWTAECRTLCSGSCAAANQTCVDVSSDLGLAQGADPLSICAPSDSVDSRARGESCLYSYECQGDDVCSMTVAVCAPPSA